MEEPLVDREVLLEKFPGKGGWTYARIPEILPEKSNHFGWRKVRGFIDSYEIKQYHLMPMGKGQLFLPVKAEIRKLIKKQEGDWVKIILFPDDGAQFMPSDFLLCLEDEPDALHFFKSLTEFDKQKYLDWIALLRDENLRIERMAEAISKLARKEKLK